MKTPQPYWNPLSLEQSGHWQVMEGSEGKLWQLTLAVDPDTGDYTRLTKFLAGADTSAFGPQSHPYPEEILILSGRLYDAAFSCWLEVGHYANRPPGELHGPFRAAEECIVLEVSYPSQTVPSQAVTLPPASP